MGRVLALRVLRHDRLIRHDGKAGSPSASPPTGRLVALRPPPRQPPPPRPAILVTLGPATLVTLGSATLGRRVSRTRGTLSTTRNRRRRHALPAIIGPIAR